MDSESKETMSQPLSMRRDYGDKETEKESAMLKEVPIQNYDEYRSHSPAGKKEIYFTDYDDPHPCEGGCLMCDR